MKIEALESLKSDGYVLDAEDIKTVPDEIGAKWCALGWARDVNGVVPTGEKQIINAKLAIDNSVIASKSPNIGVKTDG